MEILETKIIEVNHIREVKGRFVLKSDHNELEELIKHLVKFEKPNEIRYIKSELVYGENHKEKEYVVYF